MTGLYIMLGASMKHWLLTTRMKVLAALHEYEFRHMHHLSANIDMAYAGVRKVVLDMERIGILETEKVKPVDADPTYRFTKIRLTPWGGRVARLCFELKKAMEEYEEIHSHDKEHNPPESD
jgi:predicted transcriptional regulator